MKDEVVSELGKKMKIDEVKINKKGKGKIKVEIKD